ncbi:MAG: SGNH/GDSL hydrolase family protein [Bdellovibrionales bacterium]|nr:SGNH/GDSL hydrolase family protein [Bdellovibrionales bacterium]
MTKRVRLFLKGNSDLHDSLVVFKNDGKVEWNGIGEFLTALPERVLCHATHELFGRSDLLRCDVTGPPEDLQKFAPSIRPFLLERKTKLYEGPYDAFIFSIQADVTHTLLRHVHSGYLFAPGMEHCWPDATREWMKEHCERVELLTVSESIGNFEEIVTELRSRSNAPILVSNMNPHMLFEHVSCFQGVPIGLSERISAFNSELRGLSRRTGVSIIDVEKLFALQGVRSLSVAPMHYTARAYRIVAEEVFRVLEEYGLWD